MKRTTIQRNLILEAINILKNHATADEAYEQVKKMHPNISRATVYRNLNFLAEEGAIMKIEVPDGADCFDHATHKHYHAKCIHCGKLVDVNLKYLEHLEEKIKDTEGFKFYSHNITFKGVCKKCQSIIGLNPQDKL